MSVEFWISNLYHPPVKPAEGLKLRLVTSANFDSPESLMKLSVRRRQQGPHGKRQSWRPSIMQPCATERIQSPLCQKAASCQGLEDQISESRLSQCRSLFFVGLGLHLNCVGYNNSLWLQLWFNRHESSEYDGRCSSLDSVFLSPCCTKSEWLTFQTLTPLTIRQFSQCIVQ